MDFPGKKSQFWIFSIFLLFVLISAGRVGIAHLISLHASRSMNAWNSASQVPSVLEVEAVFNEFNFARSLTDSDPTLYENLSRLRLVRAALPGVLPDEKYSQLRAGLVEIRKAIRLRPISPYSWVILLALKRDLNEFDAEFRLGLHRAVELGPWEPQVLNGLADVGLSAWDAMPAEERALIQQVFIRGMARQSIGRSEVAPEQSN